MIMFKKSGAQFVRSQKEIVEELLDSSEEYMMKTIFQALGTSVTGFPDELDESSVKLVNDALGYWKTSKSLAISAAELQDRRDAELRASLDSIQEELKAQRKILEELSRKKDK